jgi:hypothetical protein
MPSKATIQLDVISCFFVSVVRKKKSLYRIKKKRISLELLWQLTA